MAKSTLRLVRPTTEKRTVTPRRRPDAELRTREHLMEREVERLIEAAKANRHGHRDATMVLLGGPSLGTRWTSIGPSCTSAESSKARLRLR